MTLPRPFKCIEVTHLPGDHVTGVASTGARITGTITEYLAHVVDDRNTMWNGYFRPQDLQASPRQDRRTITVRRVWQDMSGACPGRRVTSFEKSGRRVTDPTWSNYIFPGDRRISTGLRRQSQQFDTEGSKAWSGFSHARRARTTGRRVTDEAGTLGFYYQDRRVSQRRVNTDYSDFHLRRLGGAGTGRRYVDNPKGYWTSDGSSYYYKGSK
jgi:hypothetical protein